MEPQTSWSSGASGASEAHAGNAPREASASAQAQHPDQHPELAKAVSGLQHKLDSALEEVRNDPDLAWSERHTKIRHVWGKAQQLHAELLEGYENRLEEGARAAEQSLFNVPPPLRDSVRSAYNDVYDRTQHSLTSGEVEDLQYAQKELERLWERGVRTGDRALQYAVGQRALELGEDNLRSAYLASSEEKRRAWEKYVAAQSRVDDFRSPEGRLRLGLTGNVGLREPPEVR